MTPVWAANNASSSESLFTETAEPAILEPDQAFKLSVYALDAQTLQAAFEIAPGHYLYRDRISFTLKEANGSTLDTVALPPGETKHDPNFGDTVVFHHSFDTQLRLHHTTTAPERVTLLASYQGCSERGLCYAPIRKTLEIELPKAGGTAAAASESDRIQSLLRSGKLWLVVLGFFSAGLLLSLTPCVFPMIPILSGIIVGQGQHPSRLHAFNLSLSYTLGMAVSYTLAGIAAAFSGHLISATLQNPWALGFGALMFVLLALSMFGFYELQLPSALESRVVNATNRIKGGRFASVFVMGALSALIVSPCVAAPLAGALLYIGNTHDVLLGGLALFALSLGMGVPLLALGASAGALMPRTGPWMEAVSKFFGVVMLGMAVWLVGPVIPAALQLGLWGSLLIVSAIYLNALDSLPQRAGNWPKLWKGLGIVMLVFGVAMLLGALAGNRNPLQPLAGLQATTNDTSVTPALPFRRINSVAHLETALQEARGQYVMLDFYADWCASCKEYEKFTFRDPRIGKKLQNAILLQADVTQNTSDDSALLARFGLYGPPGIIFFSREGKELPSMKVIGYQDADKFLGTLAAVFATH